MEKEKIVELITRYNQGQATPEEIKKLEQLIEDGNVELSQFDELHQLEEQLMAIEGPSPSDALDVHFYAMLKKLKRESSGFTWAEFFSWPVLAPRLAIASVTLILGLFIGNQFRPAADHQEVDYLNQQVAELREMMMFSLLENESATDRLKAVGLTQEMDHVSNKVTMALIKTLDNDPNVNVRLSALEALKPYTRSDSVREQLIRSIAKQDSPVVQVALAELMVALHERKSVQEFKKILENENTPADVKTKIEESIKVMI